MTNYRVKFCNHFLFKLTLILSLIFYFSKNVNAFIGGYNLSENIFGLVKFYKSNNVSPCSGTFIGTRYIMTASHCISTSVDGILNLPARIVTGPHLPFKTKISVLTEPKQGLYKDQVIEVKDIHFYQKFAFNRIGLTHRPDINELLIMGDLAIVELTNDIQGLSSFSNIHLGTVYERDKVWVGGFGKRGPKFNHIDVSNFKYKGSFAEIGKQYDDIKFEVNNVKNEITYIAPGDSGGGVFKKIDNSYYLVGVNHAGYSKILNIYYEIDQDPNSGKVLIRSTIDELQAMGFIHYFRHSNDILRDWIEKVLNN